MEADQIRSWMADFLLDGPDPARQAAFDAALAADPALRAEWDELQAAASWVDALPAEGWGPVDLEAMRDRVHAQLEAPAAAHHSDAALAELLTQPPVPDEELHAVWPQLLQASAWADLLPAAALEPQRLASLQQRIRDAVAAESVVEHAATKLDREAVQGLMAEFAETGVDGARAPLFEAALRSHPELATEWTEVAGGLTLAAALPAANVTPRQLREVRARIDRQVRAEIREAARRDQVVPLFALRRLAPLALAASVLGIIFVSHARRPAGGGGAPTPQQVAAKPEPPAPEQPAAGSPTKLAQATPPADAPVVEAPVAPPVKAAPDRTLPRAERKSRPKRRARVDESQPAASDNRDVEGSFKPQGPTRSHASVAIAADDAEPGPARPVTPPVVTPTPPTLPTPAQPELPHTPTPPVPQP